MNDGLEEAGLTEADITEAYVYLLARYLVIRQKSLDLAQDGVRYNRFHHHPPIGAGAATTPGIDPDPDVLHSEAWVAVDARTPVLLHVPEIPDDRYYSVQIIDEWAEITHDITPRNHPGAPHGIFALCLADSAPTLPADCARLDLPTAEAKILARTQIGAVLPRAVVLQHQFTLTPTGVPLLAPSVPFPLFTNAELPGVEAFSRPRLDDAFAPADTSPDADRVRPLIRRVAEFAARGDAESATIDSVVRTVSIPRFIRYVTTSGDLGNGWRSTARRTAYGAGHWHRATTTFAGIWGHSRETAHFVLHSDHEGHPVSGENAYTLRFEPDRHPGAVASAFWSLSVYAKPDHTLVPDPTGRHSLGDRSALTPDRDGSLTIHLAPEPPADAPRSHWLPTPAERAFTANLRLYLPAAEVGDGTWSPPPLRRR